jgi:hypothetical protein
MCNLTVIRLLRIKCRSACYGKFAESRNYEASRDRRSWAMAQKLSHSLLISHTVSDNMLYHEGQRDKQVSVQNLDYKRPCMYMYRTIDVPCNNM